MSDKPSLHLDRPIKSLKDDKLYYNDLYAGKLEVLIEEHNDKTIKIGLFAKFGSGKTSTINLLFERLKQKKQITNKKNNRFFVHIKSIWDYTPDDILKKILVNVDCQGKLGLNLSKRINVEESIIDPQKRWDNLVLYLWISLLALVIMGIIEFVFNSMLPTTINLFVELIATGLGIYLAVDTLKKQIIRPPATSYDFENYWSKIIKRANQKGVKHITIVVDDLDRCKPEIVNGIIGKLHTITDMCDGNQGVNIALIIPFSLANYLTLHEDKEIEMLRNNYKKFFDFIIDMPELDSLELQRLSQNENKL